MIDAHLFARHAGDAFRWRKDGGDWTTPQSMTSVGLVERDFSNVGTSKTVNVDVRATGEYSGAADATIALEVLPGGATFRWKKHAYMPRAGSLNQTSTAGAYCCGTEDVMLDSLTDAARGVGQAGDNAVAGARGSGKGERRRAGKLEKAQKAAREAVRAARAAAARASRHSPPGGGAARL